MIQNNISTHTQYLPMTVIELENWMKENCFNFNNYSISGNKIDEGFGIEITGDCFSWYFTERGGKDHLKSYKSESEIVEYAFNQIRSDHSAKMHCIGLSADKTKIDELKGKLQQLTIEYCDDEIPYFGKDKLVYRLFVSGCDIQKTEYLKEKYWTEKHE